MALYKAMLSTSFHFEKKTEMKKEKIRRNYMFLLFAPPVLAQFLISTSIPSYHLFLTRSIFEKDSFT